MEELVKELVVSTPGCRLQRANGNGVKPLVVNGVKPLGVNGVKLLGLNGVKPLGVNGVKPLGVGFRLSNSFKLRREFFADFLFQKISRKIRPFIFRRCCDQQHFVWDKRKSCAVFSILFFVVCVNWVDKKPQKTTKSC